MEIELPEKPDPVPMPGLRRPLLVTILLMVTSQLLYWTPYRSTVFFSGVLACLGGSQVAFYIVARQHARKLQAHLDEMWDDAVERMRMLPALVERHGPDEAIEIMRTADHLVEEGDFPDVQAAVAAIERHHDLEPTVFEQNDKGGGSLDPPPLHPD